MEKIKEFFKSPKATAILGLVGSIGMLCTSLINDCRVKAFIIYDIFMVGLILYFGIICSRLFKKSGNIKIANYILIGTYIFSIIMTPLTTVGISITPNLIINIIMFGIIILYLFRIFCNRKTFINNKVFILAILGYLLYEIIDWGIFYYGLREYGTFTFKYTIIVIKYLCYLTIIPYFNNYYRILKEEKPNGK